ncbi:hypothetical protein XELAEV_18000770mg [Xenopus laevis]|nr:hypothetical protein XELAEV_18000770mg [Xenopus laevis]
MVQMERLAAKLADQMETSTLMWPPRLTYINQCFNRKYAADMNTGDQGSIIIASECSGDIYVLNGGAHIQYREREPFGEGNPALQSLHSNIERDTYIKGRIHIQYSEREPLGGQNPVLQSLHSNIQRGKDTIQGEGTIGGMESCSAELAL